MLLLLFLAGCAGADRALVYAPPPGRPTANLALGRTPDETWLAEAQAYRTTWPAVDGGYIFDDISTYSELIYDDQSFYDTRYGGGYTRAAVSARRGVLVR